MIPTIADAFAAGISLFGFIGLGLSLIGLAATAFWIWMLIDCATNKQLTGSDKVIWILIVIFLNWLGGLIYFLVIRNKRT
ncbi:MAG TPA: PLDc N-terminal domain-containing protein [Chthoniobacteraceae bacterium]|jgi:hypothetical protein|nr:PLDc N-terminal domain-containing protein [Chthoniobacteraceae bacterium]